MVAQSSGNDLFSGLVNGFLDGTPTKSGELVSSVKVSAICFAILLIVSTVAADNLAYQTGTVTLSNDQLTSPII